MSDGFVGDRHPLLFTNGSVLGHPPGTAVLTSGELISHVGPTDALEAAAPADTERVDLAGGMLSPGFQDAHVHPPMGGLQRLRCDLEPADSLDQAIYGRWWGKLYNRLRHLLNANTRSGSRRNVASHYDLGNDF